MKKVLAILMAACLCVTLAACGGNSGDHKHVYTDKSSCDLCGEKWHATETDAYTFTPVVLDGVEGYDVTFGEYSYVNQPLDPVTGLPDYTQPAEEQIKGTPYEEEEIVLPCVHDGKPVISVGRQYSCASYVVKKITIPDSIFSFGGNGGAFALCESLEEIVLPHEPNLGGKSRTEGYASSPLSYSALFSSHADSPLSQNYQDGMLYIGDYLIDIASIESSVLSVKEGTKGITVGTFRDIADSEVAKIRIPASVTEIRDIALAAIGSLKSIEVAKGNPVYHSDGNCLIETNNKILLAGCKTSVIPNDGSVTSIGDSAFDGCSALTSIAIPRSVSSIGSYAFNNCSSLTEIQFKGTVNEWKSVVKGYGWDHAVSYRVVCTDGTIANNGTVTYN